VNNGINREVKRKDGTLSVVDEVKIVGKSLQTEFLLLGNHEKTPKTPVKCFSAIVSNTYYHYIVNITHNYWVFGFFPSPAILETRKHDISETGSVSVLR
jgi:hypothetical protein